MKTFLYLVFAAVLLTGCRTHAPEPAAFDRASHVTAGAVQIDAFFDREPPQVKGNVVWIRARRGNVPAPPTVEVVMPAMGTMPEMRTRADVTDVGGGVFRAAFDLPMGGGWSLEVTVPDGKATFSFTTGSKGLIGDSAPTGAATPAGSPSDGGVRIEPMRRQQYGIRTAAAEVRPLSRELRALGTVAWDETAAREVTVPVGGYVRRLRVDRTGQEVHAGQTLFDLYSPDLVAAEEEYLVAIAHHGTSGDELVQAGRTRLLRLGLQERDIADIEAHGEAIDALPIRAAVSGTVIEKAVTEGGAFEPGDVLYRIAPAGRVWVEADVFANDLALVRPGQAVTVSLPGVEAPWNGTIDLVRPEVDPMAHTGKVRVAIDAATGLLPGMYADVRIPVDLGERLVVPASAVMYAGPRNLVFVDQGGGWLTPHEVTVGASTPDWVEVSGVAAGDLVVSSGTFLVASESRLRSATDLWEAPHG